MKRTTLLELFNFKPKTNFSLLSTEQLIKTAENAIPDIKNQLQQHETHTRIVLADTIKVLPIKELLLELLLKIKSLKMAYVGLDVPSEGKRSNSNLIHNTFNSEIEKRDPTLCKRLAVSAKIHDGGIIALVGARHLIGIAKHLPEQFTEPLLKSHVDSLPQFKFIRLINPDFSYILNVEKELDEKFAEIAKNNAWFKLTKVNFAEADLIFNLITNVGLAASTPLI